MVFDPSTIGDIGTQNQLDVVGSIQKGVQLKDMLDREQMQGLELGQAKRQDKEDQQVQAILKSSRYSTPQEAEETAAKINRVSPGAAMKFLGEAQKYQSGKVSAQIEQLSLASQQQDMIVQSIDPIVAQARTMKNNGASDLEVNAFIAKSVPAAVQQLQSARGQDGQPLIPPQVLAPVSQSKLDLPTLEGWETRSKAGSAAIKQRLDQFKADTQARAEGNREKGETERERKDREDEALKKQAAQMKEQASEFGGKEGDLLGALADRGVSLPAGLRSKAQMKATLTALVNRHPDQSPDQIALGIETGQIDFKAESKETQISSAIAGKIRYAEEEINRMVPLVQQAAAKIPRGDFVPWNRLKQYGESQMSNPDLKRLKAYMTTLSNSYDVLAARGGTDVEKRKHNREMFDSADSPEALQAALDAVSQEAKISGEAAQASETPRLINAPGQQKAAPPAPAHQQTTSPSPATGGSAGGGALKPGNTYKHSSGATVEILD